jgi:uncharacterized membrane protein YbhN (UPF0104 family)
MNRYVRFLLGVTLGGVALAAYLFAVGVDSVVARTTAVALPAVAGVVVLVVLEGVVDGIGVWASLRPLNGGVSPTDSVQFALAGDFFDVLSPAGPVSSEPIMARFLAVATDTGYSDALGVRATAKYVKSGSQLAVSAVVGVAVLVDAPRETELLWTLGGGVLAVVAVGVVILAVRGWLSTVLVAVLAPVVARLSGLYRDQPHGRPAVKAAVERFWTRALSFRDAPGLLALIVLGGALEQVLTAAALWVALAGTGSATVLLALVAVVPLPQIASVVPVPGSVGAYDVLLSGAVVVAVGTSAPAATAAVLVVRTVSLPFAVTAGGFAVAFLRGWRPRSDGA